MAKDNQEVIREFLRASEAVLKLDNLSDDEEVTVGEMLATLSEKLYRD